MAPGAVDGGTVPAMPHPFLSDAWIDAAREIREKYADEVPEVEADLRINQVVTDVPFEDGGVVRSYVDTTSGRVEMELGELEDPDVTITTDYEAAKSIFVDQDPAAAMQLFMSGRVQVQGDMMKLMAMQTSMPAGDGSQRISQEIKDITA